MVSLGVWVHGLPEAMSSLFTSHCRKGFASGVGSDVQSPAFAVGWALFSMPTLAGIRFSFGIIAALSGAGHSA